MRRTVEVAIRAVKGFTSERANIAAAGITYFALLSIFPLTLFALGIFGFFVSDPEDQQRLVDRLLDQLPIDQASGRGDLESTIDSIVSARGALGLFGLLGLLYSGSALFTAIRTALNGVFRVEKPRPFVVGKLLDISLVFFFGVLVLVSIGASFAISIAARFSEDIAGENAATLVFWLLTLAYVLLPPLISLLVFTLLYAIVPAKNVTIKEALPGGLAAMLLFEGLKIGFTQYVGAFGNYDATYGALGFVIIMLMFIYLSAQVMLLGSFVARSNAEVATEWPLAPGESQLEQISEKARPVLARLGLTGLLPAPSAVTGQPGAIVVPESLLIAAEPSSSQRRVRPSGTLPLLAAAGALVAAAALMLSGVRKDRER